MNAPTKIKSKNHKIKHLQHRVDELEQTLKSIQHFTPDALIPKKEEAYEFKLEGVDKPYRILVESMSEGAITLTCDGKVIHCNKRLCEMIDLPAEKIIGTSLFIYIPEEESQALKDLLDKSKMQGCKAEFTLKASDNTIKTVLLSCHNLEIGIIDGRTIVATEITELKKIQQEMEVSLKEKEVMFKEIYHRVKNNLQVISSLLNLQAKNFQDPVSRDLFLESSNRIRAMALAHEMLYKSGNLSQIEMGSYVENLSKNLINIYHIDSKRIQFKIAADTILLSLENAVPYGLIINELVSNALKHAFPNEKSGKISVLIKKQENTIILVVSDNGVGLPPHITFDLTETLGIKLVHALTKQLGGNIVIDSKNGTTLTVKFSPKQVAH